MKKGLHKLTKDELKKIQALETEMLKNVDEICLKHNLRYSIAHGTLLGQVRHGGSIPWDDDIDIAMPRADYDKLRNICKTELDKKFFYQSKETDPEWYFLFNKIRYNGTLFKETVFSQHNIHHGVFLDIFPLDNVPDNKFLRFIQYKCHSFYRLMLHSKYINLSARHGFKKIAFGLIKILSFPFSLNFLYKKCIKISTKYNNKNYKNVRKFDASKRVSDIILNIDDMFDTERVKYENITVNRTKDYDHTLRMDYGNYMQLPPVEKRCTIHDLVDLEI